MFEQRVLDDYLPGEYCVFVRSTHFDNETNDLSMFTMREWQYLLELSIVYSEVREHAKQLPDGDGKSEMIRQAQLFYGCAYCRRQTPKEMEWSLVAFDTIQHPMLVEEYMGRANRTYNGFRAWVRENVDRMDV